MNWLKRIWCDWTHGGGQIKRDSNDRINWQCNKCGRWSVPVDAITEKNITSAALESKT